MGREEAGVQSEHESALLRLITPLTKLLTGKQAVRVTSEVLECFGGAGYVEDTGLPRLLRDAQVLPIWEGTTNVLSLDALRAIAKGDSLDALSSEIDRLIQGISGPLGDLGRRAQGAVPAARAWPHATYPREALDVEAGARSFAMCLGRSLSLALLVRHAAWSEEHEGAPRTGFAAAIFASHGVAMEPVAARTMAHALALDVASEVRS